MPNGISCAYFAAKNFIIGKKDDNIFRTGIAGAQTARTLNCVSKSAPIINNASKPAKALNKIAAFARKIVYPLIIASGVYTTAKSDDKIKTGTSQAAAITTMYCSEKAAEKILKNLSKKIPKYTTNSSNKYAKVIYYILKGCFYASASILGYDLGNKSGKFAVDKIRALKCHNNTENNNEKTKQDKITNEGSSDLNNDEFINSGEDIFDDITENEKKPEHNQTNS